MADKHTQLRSQSKATKPITSTWRITMPEPMLRLEYNATYDYSRAKLDEWYTLWQKDYTMFKHRPVWRPVLTGAGEYNFPVTGDYRWAKRIAKAHDISVPPATHRLSQQDTRSTVSKTKRGKNAPKDR